MSVSTSPGSQQPEPLPFLHFELNTGSLEAGKVADMVVLAGDPLTCDLDRLKDIEVDRTFLGGLTRPAWRREQFCRRW